MKKSSLLLILAFLVVCAFAQHSPTVGNSATAQVTGTIVQPIGISKNIDMNFGNVAAGLAPGYVTLYPNATRNPVGGVTLPAITGTVAAADFTVTGFPNSTYSITLPVSVIITSPGSFTMTVNNWTSSPSGTGTINNIGTSDLTVGADMQVGASQAVGVYTGNFTVTVNYN